ncbi:MAG: TVP38/TMEM64 family protein [Alphaproteobacteria bacterium]
MQHQDNLMIEPAESPAPETRGAGATDSAAPGSGRPGGHKGRVLRRWLPVAVLGLGFVLFFVFGLQRHISFAALQEHREWLVAEVARNEVLVAAAFIGIYALVVAFSIPGGAVMTISAGFLFGTIAAACYGVVGGTMGAVCVFLAARTAFGDVLRAKAGPALKRMETGFRDNAFSYMLFLRLIPLFPFWLVNLVPAFLGVSLRTYFLTTLVGVIPGALVFASLGNGLGVILDAGEEPDLGILLRPDVLLPLLALAVLALAPVAYKKLKARN